ncbi:hypothetical protein [Gryllotalpicola sp.]|uniref:hypothetical protein n=1 Tax=Gryllotalpicola sp. TaxID=1932787 RepID=UPI0026211F52|nr:hypothetical protein [Gryllotalpicola sp.]
MELITLLGSPIGTDGLTLSFAVDEPAVLFDHRDASARTVPLGLREAGLTLLVIEPATPPKVFGDEVTAKEDALTSATATLGVASLRDVSVTDLARVRDRLDGPTYRVVRHVVTENQRVRDTLRMLRDEGPQGIGDLLYESHRSLRDDVQISRPELDLAAEVSQNYGALGARLTGSGDQLAVIALVPVGLVSQVQVSVDSAFAEHGYAQPEMYTVQPTESA